MPRRRPPKLDPATVADSSAVALVIDEVIKAAPVLSAHGRRVAELQRELRDAVDRGTWNAIVSLDDAHVDRASDLSVVLVRWAFEEGRRRPRVPSGSSGREQARGLGAHQDR